MTDTNGREIKDNSKATEGYRSVLKATSIFGGVQVFNIAEGIIRGKVLAVLIGTAGMGLNGLLMSSLKMIDTASDLGLSQSAVRDISIAHQSKNVHTIRRTYTIFKRWIWLTALLGMVLTISLSPVLSKVVFDDKSYSLTFILFSITFFFGELTGGIYTVLRGLRKIKILAKANIFGSIAGLIVAIPIFYFYGIDGVVPAIIATSAATFLILRMLNE